MFSLFANSANSDEMPLFAKVPVSGIQNEKNKIWIIIYL